MYIVDYIKHLIKDPKTQSHIKFRALLMLKDLMRKKHGSLVRYNEKKFLQRLFLLSKSKLREKVLLTYDPNANVNISKNFYHLLLECMDSWGKLFEIFKPYKEKRDKLVDIKLLPEDEKFMNVPGSDDEMVFDANDDINQISIGKLTRRSIERNKDSTRKAC